MRSVAPEKDAVRLDRMTRRAEFVAASRDGVKVGGPLIGLQMLDRDLGDETARVGFTATKRVGGAVERNRMKRRLRAAAAEALPEVARKGCDYVLIARRAVLDAPYARIVRDVAEAAKRADGRSRRQGADKIPPGAAERRESGR